MMLEELAAKYNGFYGSSIVIAGTPKARIAFLNQDGVIAIELNGEAEPYQAIRPLLD